MKFQAGESGNTNGRPKGSYGGRIMALASLDKLLARKKNQKALIAALEKDFQGNPVRFFKTVIMPLLPRESKLSFDHDGVIQWRSLLGGDAEKETTEDRRQMTDVPESEFVAGDDGRRKIDP
jgi:hypothetical protein